MTQKTFNNSSLKGKILNLQNLIQNMNDNLLKHRSQVLLMQNENLDGASFNVIELKAKKIRMNLQAELERMELQIKDHLNSQKQQNIRIIENITTLKNEKNYLLKHLGILQKRIKEIEMKLGVDAND